MSQEDATALARPPSRRSASPLVAESIRCLENISYSVKRLHSDQDTRKALADLKQAEATLLLPGGGGPPSLKKPPKLSAEPKGNSFVIDPKIALSLPFKYDDAMKQKLIGNRASTVGMELQQPMGAPENNNPRKMVEEKKKAFLQKVPAELPSSRAQPSVRSATPTMRVAADFVPSCAPPPADPSAWNPRKEVELRKVSRSPSPAALRSRTNSPSVIAEKRRTASPFVPRCATIIPQKHLEDVTKAPSLNPREVVQARKNAFLQKSVGHSRAVPSPLDSSNRLAGGKGGDGYTLPSQQAPPSAHDESYEEEDPLRPLAAEIRRGGDPYVEGISGVASGWHLNAYAVLERDTPVIPINPASAGRRIVRGMSEESTQLF